MSELCREVSAKQMKGVAFPSLPESVWPARDSLTVCHAALVVTSMSAIANFQQTSATTGSMIRFRSSPLVRRARLTAGGMAPTRRPRERDGGLGGFATIARGEVPGANAERGEPKTTVPSS